MLRYRLTKRPIRDRRRQAGHVERPRLGQWRQRLASQSDAQRPRRCCNDQAIGVLLGRTQRGRAAEFLEADQMRMARTAR